MVTWIAPLPFAMTAHSSLCPRPGRVVALCLLAGGALGSGGVLEAQVVTGRILSAGDSSAVAAALVEALDEDDERIAAGSSGPEGRFRIEIPAGAGPFRIQVEAPFHHPASVDSLRVGLEETLELSDIYLDPAPVPLDEFRVDVQRPRFAPTPGQEWIRRHQLLGQGTFFPGVLIGPEAEGSLGSYIAERTGLELRLDRTGQFRLYNPEGGRYDCVNVRVNRWGLGRTGYRSIDEIPLRFIAAIEVYESIEDVPGGYAWDAGNRCGLVNVWLWNSW